MAINTANVVAPVLAAPEVVVLFLAGVTGKTRLGNVFRRHAFERNDFLRIALFDVCLAWPMARLATRHLVFPTANFYELRVGSVREGFELIFVAVFTRVATYIIFGLVGGGFGLTLLISGVRRAAGTEPNNGRYHEDTDQGCFDDFKHKAFLEILFALD